MKTKLFLLLSVFLLISFVTAQGMICVDFDKPSAPSNLILTKVSGGIQLTWNDATDIPSCSGIAYYDIYRGFNDGSLNFIGNSNSISFLDNINPQTGAYTYIIHAWDLVGHNEGNGVSNSITFGISGGVVTPSGGRSGSSGGNNIYSCGEWEECINGIQERICTSGNLQTTETRNCLINLSSTTPEEEILTTQKKPGKGLFGITGGAITDFATSGAGIATIGGFIILLLGGIVFLKVRKK